MRAVSGEGGARFRMMPLLYYRHPEFRRRIAGGAAVTAGLLKALCQNAKIRKMRQCPSQRTETP